MGIIGLFSHMCLFHVPQVRLLQDVPGLISTGFSSLQFRSTDLPLYFSKAYRIPL